jgi:DNA-binding protein H-NS
MSTYVKLQKQIEVLQAEAAKLLADEKAGKIAEVKAIIQTYSLTPQEVFGRGGSWKGKGKPSAQGKSRAAAYGDSNGNTWGGRGPRPQWLRDALANGSQLDDFALQGKQAAASPAASKRTASKKTTAKKARQVVRKTPTRKAASKRSASSNAAAPKSES